MRQSTWRYTWSSGSWTQWSLSDQRTDFQSRISQLHTFKVRWLHTDVALNSAKVIILRNLQPSWSTMSSIWRLDQLRRIGWPGDRCLAIVLPYWQTCTSSDRGRRQLLLNNNNLPTLNSSVKRARRQRQSRVAAVLSLIVKQKGNEVEMMKKRIAPNSSTRVRQHSRNIVSRTSKFCSNEQKFQAMTIFSSDLPLEQMEFQSLLLYFVLRH